MTPNAYHDYSRPHCPDDPTCDDGDCDCQHPLRTAAGLRRYADEIVMAVSDSSSPFAPFVSDDEARAFAANLRLDAAQLERLARGVRP